MRYPFSMEDPMATDRLTEQITFLLEIDKLKDIQRRTYLVAGNRRENTAEHSWHVSVMAMLLAEHAEQPIELMRVLQMLLVHDIVEVDAGDTYCYDSQGGQDKEKREKQAAERLFSLLPADQGQHFRQLWEEFDARQTPESRFANACDRLLPMMHNYYSGGISWKEHDIRSAQVYERNGCISEGSKAMWGVAEELIRRGLAEGLLRS